MNKCSICGKPLTDPISCEIGKGSVCRISEKNESARLGDDMFLLRASFDCGFVDGVLCIYDRKGAKSVTNDIERVLGIISGEWIWMLPIEDLSLSIR